MAADVACHLPAARGVPDVDGVMQVKVLDQVGEVVGVVVHVIALADLRGAAVPAPVMGDHPVAVVQEEQHLGVPVVDRPRREEYADQTRAAVIAAARRLGRVNPNWIWPVFRDDHRPLSVDEEHALAEQGEGCAAVHLPFDHLGPVDVALDDA